MALINCPECGNEISELAKQCPKCGCPVTKKIIKNDKKHNQELNEGSVSEDAAKSQKKKGTQKIAIAVICVSLVGIVVILSVFMLYPQYATRQQYKTAEKLVKDKKYSEAIEIYQKLGDYKDSKSKSIRGDLGTKKSRDLSVLLPALN